MHLRPPPEPGPCAVDFIVAFTLPRPVLFLFPQHSASPYIVSPSVSVLSSQPQASLRGAAWVRSCPCCSGVHPYDLGSVSGYHFHLQVGKGICGVPFVPRCPQHNCLHGSDFGTWSYVSWVQGYCIGPAGPVTPKCCQSPGLLGPARLLPLKQWLSCVHHHTAECSAPPGAPFPPVLHLNPLGHPHGALCMLPALVPPFMPLDPSHIT